MQKISFIFQIGPIITSHPQFDCKTNLDYPNQLNPVEAYC